MRLISIANVEPNQVLAKTIQNEKGHTLLNAGVKLNDRMIDRLKEMNVTLVYIEDDRTNDIEVEEVLKEETRQKAIETIKDQFNALVESGSGNYTVAKQDFGKEFKGTINNILNDLRTHKDVVNVLIDVHAYDNYTFKHSMNVSVYSLAIARALEYNEQQLMEVGLGAILHDVGKISISREVLDKKGPLTKEERQMMQEHTTAGFEILRKLHEIPLLSAHCAYQHHERVDGKGYPRGLEGDKIHPYAKIIAVADVFDALISERSYRKAMLPHLAMEVIYSGAGTAFDMEIVQTFRDTVCIYPTGLEVVLSNGCTGIVVRQNFTLPSRPVIRLLTDKNGYEIDDNEEIDLKKNNSVVVVDCKL